MHFNVELKLGTRRDGIVSDTDVSSHMYAVDFGDVDRLTYFRVVLPFAPIDDATVNSFPGYLRWWNASCSALQSQIVFFFDHNGSRFLEIARCNCK